MTDRAARSRGRNLAILALAATLGAGAAGRAEENPPPAPADPDKPAPDLVIKGFGDINLAYRDDGTPGGFSLGELDLFLTSELTSDLSVLAEIVFEPQEGSNPELELERYVIRWSARDSFQLALGRMHTPLGYWNQAFHHGKWFQTTIERPIVYRWEHDGGVLPVHEVGLQVLGAVPVLGHHARVQRERDERARPPSGRGAGPARRQLEQGREPVARRRAALAARAEARRGGALRPHPARARARARERPRRAHRRRLLRVHAAPGEALGEVLRVEHEASDTGERWRTLGLYLQGAVRLGRFKPYYRYDYQDIDAGDPFYVESGTQSRHTLGVRYDPWSWAALKLELYHEQPPAAPGFNAVAFQAAFTF